VWKPLIIHLMRNWLPMRESILMRLTVCIHQFSGGAVLDYGCAAICHRVWVADIRSAYFVSGNERE
jgi:hypothetical protein